MPITPLPPPPTRDDGDNFGPKCDATFAAFPTFVSELNTFGASMAGSFTAASSTSLLIGTGSKSLTITTGTSLKLGQTIVLARTAAAENQMVGKITAHDSTSGALTVLVDQIAGSGTYTDWTIALVPANAPALAVDSRVLLATVNASAASTVDFTISADATIGDYILTFNDVLVSTAGANLQLRYRVAASYLTSGYTDHYDMSSSGTTANTIATGIGTAAAITFVTGIGNSASDTAFGEIRIGSATSATVKKLARAIGAKNGSGGGLVGPISATGTNSSTGALDGLRILPSAGTVTGTFKLYGVKK